MVLKQTRPVVPSTPPRWDLDFEGLARDLHPLGNPTRVKLLNFLTLPRYLEEVASFLQVNRYAAKKHMDQLVATGIVAKAPRQREQGVVVEYRLVPERLFELFDSMRALGTLRPVAGPAAPPSQTKEFEPSARPAPRSATRFVVVYGVDLGAVVPLEGKAAYTLGRDPDCEVQLASDPFASGRHARLERGPRGFILTDLHSRNGTFLDWERVAPGQTVPVENGQVVGVGKTLLLFRTP